MTQPHHDLIPCYQGLQWLDLTMPQTIEPWPPQQTAFLGPKDQQKISPKQDRSEVSWSRYQSYAAEHVWHWPDKPLFFLCDIHADTDAFFWFFQQMKLAHRSGSFLFIHAGLDDSIAQRIATHGLEQLNEDFRSALRSDLFYLYNGPLGNTFRTKYRELDDPLTEEGSSALHRTGLHAIVHGHRNTYEGQRLVLRHGMLHIECDASVARNTRNLEGLKGPGYAATLFSPQGHALAISRNYPNIKLISAKTTIEEVFSS